MKIPSERPPSLADVITSLGLVLYSLPVLLVHHGSQSLIGSDEGYYAEMAREIVRSGQWLNEGPILRSEFGQVDLRLILDVGAFQNR